MTSNQTPPSSASSRPSVISFNYGSVQPSSTDLHPSDIPIGSASFISSVANLSNTILGTGMLAMAHGFAQGGLIVGMITVVICGSMAYLGLYLLALCAAHPVIPHRSASFFAISQATYPRASILFDLAIAVKCFGVSISYLLIFGKLLPQVILSFQSTSSFLEQAELPHWILDRRVWIALSMTILAPVSFLPTLDSLRYISYVALLGVFNLVYVVIYKFFFERPLPSESSGAEIRWFKLDSGFLTALPLFVFAYTCAQNLFPVHNEMFLNSSRQMKSVLRACIGSAVGTYEIVGVLGYLTFGSKVSSNLIADYPHSTLVSITRFTVSILVLFSYPLQLFPCRTSLIKIYKQHKNLLIYSNGRDQGLNENEDNQENENLISNSSSTDDPNHRQNPHDSTKLFISITIFLLLASFIIAVQVERLELILGFVGSTGSTTISYILPGLFFLKLFPEEKSSVYLEQQNKFTTGVGRSDENEANSDSNNVRTTVDLIEGQDDLQSQTHLGQLDSFELKILRKLALLLVFLGFFIMIVCLGLNLHDAFF